MVDLVTMLQNLLDSADAEVGDIFITWNVKLIVP